MERKFIRISETFVLSVLATLSLCATSWAGPPGPPSFIPATPVGNAEVSTVTIVAVAIYGYWKSR